MEKNNYNNFYIKYKTGDGEKKSEYDNKDNYLAAKKYIYDQFGFDAITESFEPGKLKGSIDIISE